ncbi:Peroxisomal membrane protein PMP27 [Tulasnella sp. 403]|nr:Peroxisomal membrane protein PMP27 [Tulasnella sp. 403]
MSAQVRNLVFHPKVNQSLRVWSTTVGRDKTYRGIQYFARFYAWYCLRRGYLDQAARWNALKAALALGRKMLRLFKPVEHVQHAFDAMDKSHPTVLEKCSTVGRQIGYAGYLTFDAFVWANAIRFIRLTPETSVRVNRISQKFWLAGILFSIVNGLIKLNRHVSSMKDLKKVSRSEKRDIPVDSVEQYRDLNSKYSAIRFQLILDMLDIWLPASNLGYVWINDGVAGIIGVITSSMGFHLQWLAANAKK